MTVLDDDKWGNYFNTFQRSAWRFETQRTYLIRSTDSQFDRFVDRTNDDFGLPNQDFWFVRRLNRSPSELRTRQNLDQCRVDR